MKKLLLILAFLGASLAASAQNYNFNIGGLQYASGPSVPGSCSRPGSYFYKNTSTKGWYICNGSTYDAMAVGSIVGAVSSVFTRTGAVVAAANDYTLDLIGSPAANVAFTMTGDTLKFNWGATNTNNFTFDSTGNPTFGLVNSTTAVTNSPTLTFGGSYQNAGTPTFAADTWGLQVVTGAGTNGRSDLMLTHSGTSGIRTFNIPAFSSSSASFTIGTASNNVGIGSDGSNNLLLWGSNSLGLVIPGSATPGANVASGGVYAWTSGAANGTRDTGLSRPAAGLVDVGTGAANSTAGFIKTAQTLQITTADVTCGTGGTISSCVAMQTVTGLSVALPLVAANWSFDCNLIVGQATAAAANQIGVQTATNGATNLAASAVANTAAAVSTAASITGVASTTTAQSVVTFTPGATGTKMPIHLWGTIEGASASGTTFNVTVLTGAAADLLTIYRGSTCQVY